MEEQLLPSGRVVYRPMSRFVDGNRIVSLLSGAETPLTIRRKVVDATRFSPRVPATEAPPFKVAMGVRVCTPTGLARTSGFRHAMVPGDPITTASSALARRAWTPVSGCLIRAYRPSRFRG